MPSWYCDTPEHRTLLATIIAYRVWYINYNRMVPLYLTTGGVQKVTAEVRSAYWVHQLIMLTMCLYFGLLLVVLYRELYPIPWPVTALGAVLSVMITATEYHYRY